MNAAELSSGKTVTFPFYFLTRNGVTGRLVPPADQLALPDRQGEEHRHGAIVVSSCVPFYFFYFFNETALQAGSDQQQLGSLYRTDRVKIVTPALLCFYLMSLFTSFNETVLQTGSCLDFMHPLPE